MECFFTTHYAGDGQLGGARELLRDGRHSVPHLARWFYAQPRHGHWLEWGQYRAFADPVGSAMAGEARKMAFHPACDGEPRCDDVYGVGAACGAFVTLAFLVG